MDDYIREEITRRIFIHGSPNVQIPCASKALILDKEELVLDNERNILSSKLRDYLSYNQGEIQVLREGSPHGKGMQP